MKKLQQFYILKFSSERLKRSKYNIQKISLDEARQNEEVISITNSELIRAIFRYKGIEYSQNEVDSTLISIKKTKKLQNSEENRIKLEKLEKKLEKMLFLEDLVSIEFNNKLHYLAILKRRGFFINGNRYVPFMASAGMIRQNTAMFINSTIKHPLMDILENGRNENVPLIPAKFGAYFSLYSSATLPVSFPNFAVIPDKEIESLRKVDYVTYSGEGYDDEITETNMVIKSNAWDGQGLISPGLAEKWSKELELDYTLSSAIIRAPFMKGMVVNFDFHKFANEVAKKYNFIDIYGNKKDIRQYDLIISESMFKLWSSYDNTESYREKCFENKLGFSIAKVNPKRDKNYTRTSYQFLQVLNLNDNQIRDILQPTVSWLNSITGKDPESMLIYSCGENNQEAKDFDRMEPFVKAIAINRELGKDRFVRSKFSKSVRKKIKESYMGSLLINANYQFMVADPYWQAAQIFGMCDTIKPLLNEKEYYSEYWINNGIERVAAVRSPIVHHSEFNILDFKNTYDLKYWYSNIHSGVVFPANGIGMDCAIHGGSDFDGDLICTINNPFMCEGKIESNPIVYDSNKSEKKIIDSRNDREQVESQLKGHNSKVGFATNISSANYCLAENFPINSPERKAIMNRLKIGRVIQGEIIDSVKGLSVPPFREHWTKYKKITKDMSPEDIKRIEFNNKILCTARPSFFRFLYPDYMRKYNQEIKRYDYYSRMTVGKSFSSLFENKSLTEEETKLIGIYNKHSFFIDNNSTMNRFSRLIRMKYEQSKIYNHFIYDSDYDYSILEKDDFEVTAYGLEQMKEYLQDYKNFKRGIRKYNGEGYDSLESFASYLRKECFSNISSNEAELATYAVEITYGDEVSMCEFPWTLFSDGILENIKSKSFDKVTIPVQDDDGDIIYLWGRYSLKEIEEPCIEI